MNDIKLEKTSSNTFDWSFKDNDLENVIGYQQLISAVVHTIMLRRRELEQYIYQGKGSTAHNYLGLPFEEAIPEIVQKELEQECEQINGVENVDITLTVDGSMMEITEIKITTTSGGLLTI